MESLTPYFLPILQIIWIDLLLSGDNAVVIALACRSLPERQRKIGMVLGAGTAIGLRIVFAIFITYLLGIPFLKVVGGALLLWIGVKLALGEEEGGHHIESSENLWRAVRTIAVADAVMSLDNVVAIAAASGGNIWLFIFGLLLSIPLIVFGSTLLSTIIDRYPLIIWAGAALLGWIAGEMIVSDPFVMDVIKGVNAEWIRTTLESDGHEGLTSLTKPIATIYYGAAFIGAAFVVALAWLLKRKSAKGHAV